MINKSLVIIPLAFSLLVGCGHNSQVSKSNITSSKPEPVVSAQDNLDQSIKAMDDINKSLDNMNKQMEKNNDRLQVLRDAVVSLMTDVCPEVLSNPTAKNFPDQVVECQKMVEANHKGQN